MLRKMIALGATTAMMLAAASPAFAHTAAGDVDVEVVDASQQAFVFASQVQAGDAFAVSGDVGSAADASISNSLDISVWQWNGGL